MPKTPIDYQNTFIYKLVHKDDLDDKNIYIGHSTNFKQRKADHKKSVLNPERCSSYVYDFIRENGGWNSWDMLKVEDYPCKDVYEAKNRERYWIKELKPSLNNNEPLRTSKEHYEDNKDVYSMKAKKIYEDNADVIKQRVKKYRLNNLDVIKQKKKDADIKVICDICGCQSLKSHLKRHQSSLKCLNAKKNNTE